MSSSSIAAWFRSTLNLPFEITFPLLIIVLTLAGLFAVSEWSVRRLDRTSTELETAVQVGELIQQWRVGMLEAESGQRGYLLTGKTDYLKPLMAAGKRLPLVMQQLRAKVADDPPLRVLVAELAAPARAKFADLALTLRLMQDGEPQLAMQQVESGEGMRLMADLRERFAALEMLAANRATEARAARERNALIARVAILFSTLVIAGLIIKLLQLIAADAARRELMRREEVARRELLEQEVATRTKDLSSLSSHLQRVAEAEKSELARELHDEMGGLLTAAKMDLAWLHHRPSIKSDNDSQAKLVSLGTVLDQAMGMKRRVVESLRPSLLEHFGLTVALQSYFEDMCAKANLECVVTVPESVDGLDRAAQLTLFRIAQEALTNVLRHAKAKHVELVLEQVDDDYVMTIGDDGVGFDIDQPGARTSHGIAGMRQRAAGLVGDLQFESPPGGGTRITLRVPRAPADSG